MTIKPEVLDALLAAGATAEMIVAAVKADLASDDERRERKRAGNAERQRRFKSRQKDQEVTTHNEGNALPHVTPSLSRPLPSPHTPQPTPTHTHPDNNTRARKTPAKPEDVSEQVWADFVAHRRAKRAPVTETALDGIRREAEKAGWLMEAALAECVTRNWQAFKADWVGENRPQFPRMVNSPADVDPMLAAFQARKLQAAPP